MTNNEEQIVVFEIADELYGVDIASVNTIVRMQEITEIPRAPDFIEGVINLRGQIIPVINLRARLGFTCAEETKASRIIIAECNNDLVGLIVDSVTETIKLANDSVQPPIAAKSEFVLGIGKLEDRFVILIDLERVLTTNNLSNKAA